MVKKLPVLLLIAAPFFIPVQTRANFIGDLLRDLFGKPRTEKPASRPTLPPQAQGHAGNAVPIDGGLILLMVAGLGLGAKMIYDAKAKKTATVEI